MLKSFDFVFDCLHIDTDVASPLTVASIAIILHVANYNATAQLEHYTRVFTKIFGKAAIYLYGIFLIISALLRDHYIQIAMQDDKGSISALMQLDDAYVELASYAIFAFGVLLNLWTLKALGFIGMYNGDSFGYLMDSPVIDGPYRFFSDPQYVGTTASCLAGAIFFRSTQGYNGLTDRIGYSLVLVGLMGLVFLISVKLIEGPHLTKIYSAKNKKE